MKGSTKVLIAFLLSLIGLGFYFIEDFHLWLLTIHLGATAVSSLDFFDFKDNTPKWSLIYRHTGPWIYIIYLIGLIGYSIWWIVTTIGELADKYLSD